MIDDREDLPKVEGVSASQRLFLLRKALESGHSQ